MLEPVTNRRFNMPRDNDVKVVVWTGRGCGACTNAKHLLTRKGIGFTERRLKHDPATQRSFARATGVLAPFHRSSSVSVASADSMTCCRLTNQASWMSCWGELTEYLNGRVGNDSFNGWDGDMVSGAQGHDRTIRSPWTAMRRLRSA